MSNVFFIKFKHYYYYYYYYYCCCCCCTEDIFQWQIDASVHFYFHNHVLFFCMKPKARLLSHSLRSTLRWWPSGNGSFIVSSTASGSFCSRRSCWWGRGWTQDLWRLSKFLRAPNSNSHHHSSSSSDFLQATTPCLETPLPPRAILTPWEDLWTPSCLPGGAWETKALWEAFKGSLGGLWTLLFSRGFSSNLGGLVCLICNVLIYHHQLLMLLSRFLKANVQLVSQAWSSKQIHPSLLSLVRPAPCFHLRTPPPRVLCSSKRSLHLVISHLT